MKLWKKICLGLLCIAVLTQIPFIYNRWQTGNLAGKISSMKSQKTKAINQEYTDYKGVIHVHSFLGGHSTGTFDELLVGAEKNQLDFVVMTEHASEFYDTSAMTLRGVHNKTLFIGGNETSTRDDNRFLVLDGFQDLNKINKLHTKEFLNEIHSRDRLAFVTYPYKFKSWNEEVDGIEIFSLHTNAKRMNPISFLFDAIWSYNTYPELTLAGYFERPGDNLRKFDELTKNRKATLFAGSDAHSNLGFHILGDDANNKLVDVKFDNYETIFRLVRTHILLPKIEELNKDNLLKALKNGNTFVGFDILSNTSGFSFTAENNNETKIMGDEILSEDSEINLKSNAPQVARFLLFKSGEKVFESGETTEINFKVKEKGTYRVEVYLDSLGEPFNKMPWIISNPIYVR
ncbi:MAG: hypothetical protein ACR2MD_18560 [Aridibacter sp.]